MHEQVGFADHLACPCHEHGQDTETSPTQRQRLPFVQEGLGLSQQPAIAELVGVLLRKDTGFRRAILRLR